MRADSGSSEDGTDTSHQRKLAELLSAKADWELEPFRKRQSRYPGVAAAGVLLSRQRHASGSLFSRARRSYEEGALSRRAGDAHSLFLRGGCRDAVGGIAEFAGEGVGDAFGGNDDGADRSSDPFPRRDRLLAAERSGRHPRVSSRGKAVSPRLIPFSVLSTVGLLVTPSLLSLSSSCCPLSSPIIFAYFLNFFCSFFLSRRLS